MKAVAHRASLARATDFLKSRHPLARRFCRSLLLGSFLLLAASCGGQRQPVTASAPESEQTRAEESKVAPVSAPSPNEISEIEQAQREFEAAARELEAQLHPLRVSSMDREDEASAEGKHDSAAGAPPAVQSEPGRAAPKEARPDAKKREADESSGAVPADSAARSPAGSTCDLACRAFASMERSTEHICSLAGLHDSRCARARDRVRNARDRVTKAGCSCLAWSPPR
jgi:hypothetical protein